MASTFFGLNIGLQGLYTSRTALHVTGNNLANLDTVGYSRQVIDVKATSPIAFRNGKGMLGSGSEVVDIRQIRDTYLDKKYWSQSTIYGENRVKHSSLSQVDTIFNSVSDKSYNNVSNKYFESLESLSTDPSSDTHLAVFQQSSTTFTQYFNDAAQKLLSEQDDLNFSIDATVNRINSLATQIQSLNGQISKMEYANKKEIYSADGALMGTETSFKANNLRDERAVLLDELSQLVNIDVNEDSQGRLRVTLNGNEFITHTNVVTLETRKRDTVAADKNYLDTNTSGLLDVYFTGSNKQLSASDYGLRGELKGYLEMRDGNNNQKTNITEAVNYKGIPYYLDKLNEFVRNFASLMNEGKTWNEDGNNLDRTQLSENGGFANGYGANGNTGIGLFSYKNTGNNEYQSGILQDTSTNPNANDDFYRNITALNFSISKEVSEDAKNIATRFSKDAVTDESNNDLIQAMIGLRSNGKAFHEGKIDDFMSALFTDVSVNKSEAKTYEDSQDNILLAITNQRLSVSGVSENEEMSNFVRYQEIYNACAKMISVMDEIYDVTINKLGAT